MTMSAPFARTLAAVFLAALPSLARGAQVQMHFAGRYTTGLGAGSAEIPAFDPASKHAFLVNAASSTVDILDLSNPSSPTLVSTIDVGALFSDSAAIAAPNSVAVSGGLVAVAIERKGTNGHHKPGRIGFFDANGGLIDQATTGYLPDMVVFSPDGRFALTADEGEPSADYSFDPEGSVTIVTCERVRLALANPQQAPTFALQPSDLKKATFTRFNPLASALKSAGVRIYGPNATVAQDLEPEAIAIPQGSTYAYVALQEANAIAMVNMVTGVVARIQALGFKDWSNSALDASDRDFAINIQPWPVFGMYQPDTLAAFRIGAVNYFVAANEGDARDYSTFKEEQRVKDMTLDPTLFPNAAVLRADAAIGRLTCTNQLGDTDGEGDFDRLYTFGGRSFSIYRSGNSGMLTRVYDSGDQLEQITALEVPGRFNGDPVFDTRSDNKGPEPEGVAVGVVNGNTYAFIGLERTNGVLMFNVNDPSAPQYVQYINTSVVSGSSQSGDVAPEGLVFVPASDSPNGVALLLVANEVSGTLAIFEVR
ncbi:MAG: choice-of-anchor I family protein [Planctomycetes bacterium]|nr:choice-of-anchor I family protein [Planctomycetota bacterium]